MDSFAVSTSTPRDSARLVSVTTRVQVAVRIRPVSYADAADSRVAFVKEDCMVHALGDRKSRIHANRSFVYDHVFDGGQEELHCALCRPTSPCSTARSSTDAVCFETVSFLRVG